MVGGFFPTTCRKLSQSGQSNQSSPPTSCPSPCHLYRCYLIVSAPDCRCQLDVALIDAVTAVTAVALNPGRDGLHFRIFFSFGWWRILNEILDVIFVRKVYKDERQLGFGQCRYYELLVRTPRDPLVRCCTCHIQNGDGACIPRDVIRAGRATARTGRRFQPSSRTIINYRRREEHSVINVLWG